MDSAVCVTVTDDCESLSTDASGASSGLISATAMVVMPTAIGPHTCIRCSSCVSLTLDFISFTAINWLGGRADRQSISGLTPVIAIVGRRTGSTETREGSNYAHERLIVT